MVKPGYVLVSLQHMKPYLPYQANRCSHLVCGAGVVIPTTLAVSSSFLDAV